MIQRAFDDITKEDVDFLVKDKTTEIKTLEYKEKLPGYKDKDKKEFLADIASFANSSGGDIIYGVKAARDANGKKTGAPEKVIPLQNETPDEAKLRLDNIIRTGIAPRIPVHIKEITGWDDDGDGFVIVVRIPQSFASPHMVTSNSSPFFCRSSAGKYPLDVQEIRSAFLATDSQADRVRSFIQNRIAKIMADETPMKLSATHRLVLHIFPLNSFLNKKRLDLSDINNLGDFCPIGMNSNGHRYNLDGFLTYLLSRETGESGGYCQLFFDGVIEAVSTVFFTKNTYKNVDTIFIPSEAYERNIVNTVKYYFQGYKTLGIETPVVITMTLLGCKDVYLYSTSVYESIGRDVAIFPEVETDSLDKCVPTIMKPIFDSLWNACGVARSYNYTEDGVWNVR